jgi:hypothetical protein
MEKKIKKAEPKLSKGKGKTFSSAGLVKASKSSSEFPKSILFCPDPGYIHS